MYIGVVNGEVVLIFQYDLFQKFHAKIHLAVVI